MSVLLGLSKVLLEAKYLETNCFRMFVTVFFTLILNHLTLKFANLTKEKDKFLIRLKPKLKRKE